MRTTTVSERCTTYAFQLLAKCRHLVLSGIDDDGDLEWIGTYREWQDASNEEEEIIKAYEMKQIWK